MIVEVCAGSVEDCIAAQTSGANRIELNSGLYLGGLTPSVGMLVSAKRHTTIPIITMIRPRGGGFCYSQLEVESMIYDAESLIQNGSDGLVFGFLNDDASVNTTLTQKFVDISHDAGIEAVFHRAFDCVSDPMKAIEDLIACGVDRVLTSGLEERANEGIELLAELHQNYSKDIEFCVGSGVNESNALEIVEKTGIHQLHSSFKVWYSDPTTKNNSVSYAYSCQGDYDGVSVDKLKSFIKTVQK
ncbi:copper homeostasis protein CutC [Erysipelothrix rhusiopathiae]|uniref:copper homeostasis protein CutC n=1 Tax=Erysipelothrix rhusiopathiae TaxID=1648 RepID=UPI000F430336|nr:copper homeostasis protein CutC [Erysipelothrix rhusiopathiae]AYV33916.1 copper homeostasis protein CutC [Erysipelothrix rhusiopathiae]